MNNLNVFVDSLIESSQQPFQSTGIVVNSAILLVCTLLFVKAGFWRSTPSPILLGKDDENGIVVVHPPHVRSYVPYLGSAIEMGKNIRKFIAKYGHQLRTPVFTATIAGDRCLFISDPDNVLMTHRYAKYLDDFSLQKQFVKNVLGVDPEAGVFTDTKPAIKQYHKYLFTHDELQKTVLNAQQVLSDLFANLSPTKTTITTNTDKLGQQMHPIQSQQQHWINFNLFSFVEEYVFKASVDSLISKYVRSDEAMGNYRLFDEAIPLLFAGVPSFLTKKAMEARETLVTFLNDPKFVKLGSDLIVARHEELGMTENNFSRSTLGLLFASVGNSIPAVFWALYHLLADAQVYEAAKAEVQSILDNRPQNIDSAAHGYFTLEELDRMVIIQSIFTETLRLYAGAFTTREAVQDFVMDPKTNASATETDDDDQKQQPPRKYLIEKGTRIMGFTATMHYDPEVFEDPESFQYDRFLPGKVFTKNGKRIDEPVRPFGGGAHLCPGRKFIAYEIKAFLAMLVSKMEMRLVQGRRPQDAPQIDFARQGVGVSHPDRDVAFEIRFR